MLNEKIDPKKHLLNTLRKKIELKKTCEFFFHNKLKHVVVSWDYKDNIQFDDMKRQI